MVKYETCLIKTIGRLYEEAAANFGESANDYIPRGESAIETADSVRESADSAVESADPPKIGVWVRALEAFRGPLY